jgi:hypothetical protein
MHIKLYLKALKVVRLGDSNITSYNAEMGVLRNAVTMLVPGSKETDGLGIVEKKLPPNEQNQMVL